MTEYGLANNADVLCGLADTLHAQYKWGECYAITSRFVQLLPPFSEGVKC